METSGGLGEHSRKFLKELGTRHADNNFRSRSQSCKEISQGLSVELYRSNAVMIISRKSAFVIPAETSSSQGLDSSSGPVSRSRTLSQSANEVLAKRPRNSGTSNTNSLC